MKSNFKLRFILLLSTLSAPVSLSASGDPGYLWPFTGVGVSGEYTRKSGVEDFAPGVTAMKGIVGIFSFFGSLDVGYRVNEKSIVTRGTGEVYFFCLGVYTGLQGYVNTGGGQNDLGIIYGGALALPMKRYFIRLHVGTISASERHTGELQVSMAAYFNIGERD